MVTVSMQRLRDAMPKHGTIELNWRKTPEGKAPFLECKISNPSLCDQYPMDFEEKFEEIKNWQRDIIGKENITEFYTLSTGCHWYVHLKRIPITFEV